MKKERIPMSGGDEEDALSKKSRKFYGWGRGTLKKIKRRYNKRFRQQGKLNNGSIEEE
jgi:hypothetical protein